MLTALLITLYLSSVILAYFAIKAAIQVGIDLPWTMGNRWTAIGIALISGPFGFIAGIIIYVILLPNKSDFWDKEVRW